MSNIRKVAFAACVTLLLTTPSKADIWGGDTLVLTQILTNAVEQLSRLNAVVRSGQDTLSLLDEINRGVNDSLHLISTVKGAANAGVYGDLRSPEAALLKLQQLTSTAVPSKDSGLQKNADQIVAEALSAGSAVHQYSSKLDAVGEQIQGASHAVSPGGAQKLTAQSLGVLIHSQSESLRNQALGLKLDAQSLAAQNHRDKEATKAFLQSADSLKTAMKTQSTAFEIPRF